MVKLFKQKHRYIIIHHTATSRDKTTFWAVRRYHIQRGWGNIVYEYFITPKKIYQGRKKEAVGRIDIALTGNFEHEKPTPFQLFTLEKKVNELVKKFDIPRSNILGHLETGSATLCPGKNLLPYTKILRENKSISIEEEKKEWGFSAGEEKTLKKKLSEVFLKLGELLKRLKRLIKRA